MDSFLDQLECWVPNLRRYARALLRDAEKADDVVQDCLERAISRRHLWKEDGNTRAWLFTIMHNIHANNARSLATRPVEAPLEDHEARLAAPPNQAGQMVRRELARALQKLPKEQRDVILLVALEGMSYGEVAESLGIAQGTVMSRLSRGRERLRRIMDEGSPALRVVK